MMKNEGLDSLFPMEDLAVMGLTELLPHLTKIRVSVDYAGTCYLAISSSSKLLFFRFWNLVNDR